MKILMRLMNRILPSCKEVSLLTSQAMDESLPWRKRLGLRMHLRICVWCRRNSEQLHLMRDLARGQTASRDQQARLGSDARERISKSLLHNDEQA